MPRKFHIRTFGCQMNEHDSERMAGLLEAEGMVPTESTEAADVVVFNTCCIRENADARLYGQLGAMAPLKERRPEVKVVVGGCLAQKDGADSPNVHPMSTSSSAPTTSHACRTCSSSRTKAAHRSSRSPTRPT